MAKPVLNLVVIRASDMERAAHFYHLLGLSLEKHQHGSGPEHYSAELDGCVFEIYPRRNEADSTASVRLGFQVEDVDGLTRELADTGVKVVTESANTEWGRRAVVEDPDGHRVELVSPIVNLETQKRES